MWSTSSATESNPEINLDSDDKPDVHYKELWSAVADLPQVRSPPRVLHRLALDYESLSEALTLTLRQTLQPRQTLRGDIVAYDPSA
eukprot:9471779-Pyramimonas_sp.AAC.1